MDIVIINHFGGDFSKTDNDRFLYIASRLSKDHDVEIVTSAFDHTTKSQRQPMITNWPFKIVLLDEPGYPRNVCLKRFVSHYVWGRNLANYLKTRKKPDLIYTAVPSLTGPNLIARYCEKKKIPFVIDVQDIWPEAFKMVFNVPLLSDLCYSPFIILANGIYKRADGICAVSGTYCHRARIANHKYRRTAIVYLGTDLRTFDCFAAETPILIKEPDEIWLAYCGTLGSSYDIKCVIDSLAILDDPNVVFIVMGDGPNEDEFRRYAAERGVKARFVGRLKYNEMCSFLSCSDIVVNPITHMAAQSIINKHADYAASGKPVVSTQENPEYRKLIRTYHMGFNCRNGDSIDMAEKIRLLVSDEEIRKRMGLNARRCAEECFDRKTTYNKIFRLITDVSEKRKR